MPVETLKSVELGGKLWKLPFADLIPTDPDDREALRSSILEHGVREPVLCWKEHQTFGERTVVDGATRVEICAQENLAPPPIRLMSFASEADAQAECERLNYARRHLTREQVQAKRVRRVVAARAEGKPTRTIAEEEGVSHTQVQRDLKAAKEEDENNGQGQLEHDVPTEKVVGHDGKTYPASKPKILCDKCNRLGTQVVDCPGCKLARDADAKKKKAAAAKRKKKQPPVEVKDQTGAVVPDQCRDAFADPSLVDLVGELETVEAMMTPESWVTRAGKLCAHYPFILIEKAKEHAWEALHQLQVAISDIKAGVAYAVCPKCAGTKLANTGNPCRTCRGCGHVPEWRHAELQAEK